MDVINTQTPMKTTSRPWYIQVQHVSGKTIHQGMHRYDSETELENHIAEIIRKSGYLSEDCISSYEPMEETANI